MTCNHEPNEDIGQAVQPGSAGFTTEDGFFVHIYAKVCRKCACMYAVGDFPDGTTRPIKQLTQMERVASIVTEAMNQPPKLAASSLDQLNRAELHSLIRVLLNKVDQ